MEVACSETICSCSCICEKAINPIVSFDYTCQSACVIHSLSLFVATRPPIISHLVIIYKYRYINMLIYMLNMRMNYTSENEYWWMEKQRS